MSSVLLDCRGRIIIAGVAGTEELEMFEQRCDVVEMWELAAR
jgi:hypothetical protein